MWENIGGLGLLEAVNVKRGHWINGEEPVEEALVCLDWVMGSQQSFTLKWSDRCSLQKDNSGGSMGMNRGPHGPSPAQLVLYSCNIQSRAEEVEGGTMEEQVV